MGILVRNRSFHMELQSLKLLSPHFDNCKTKKSPAEICTLPHRDVQRAFLPQSEALLMKTSPIKAIRQGFVTRRALPG